MLVLSRKLSEKIRIGDSVLVTVVRIDGNRVRLGIEAPQGVPIVRQELEVEPASVGRETGVQPGFLA
jgi:carbon storage regulator